MNHKVFFGIFIGLLAVNVSVQSPTTQVGGLVKSFVVEILNEILDLGTALLKDASDLVDKIEKDEDAIKERIVDFAVNIGKQINSLILKGVDELRDDATDDGKAVLDCIEAEQGKTDDAIGQVCGDVGTCAADEGTKVLAEVKTILGQLGDLRDDVRSQTDVLDACTESDQECLAAFATSMATTANKTSSVARSDLEDIAQLIVVIAGDVISCAGEVVKEIKADAQDIFNEAVVCIRK